MFDQSVGIDIITSAGVVGTTFACTFTHLRPVVNLLHSYLTFAAVLNVLTFTHLLFLAEAELSLTPIKEIATVEIINKRFSDFIVILL